jgi:integrase
VPVPASIWERLDEQAWREHPNPSDWRQPFPADPDQLAFPGRNGSYVTNFEYRRVFDPAAKDIGMEGLVPHELRHTCASLAIAAGANILAVQRLLGHDSATMTLDTYGHLFSDDLTQVAKSLDTAAVRATRKSLDTAARATRKRTAV